MSEHGASGSGPDFTKRPPDENRPESGPSGWPGYGEPTNGEPSYGQPSYGQPSYGQASYGQPSSSGQQSGEYDQPTQSPSGGYGQRSYGPPGWGGAPAYPQGGWAAGAPQTDGTAIAALVCAIAAWFVCPIVLAVVALVLAHNSDRTIRASGGQRTGHGLNTAARWVAWVHLAVFLLLIVGLLAAGVFFASSTSTSGSGLGVGA